jgi:hypothetical protein
MINNDLKVIDGMSIENVRKLKGKQKTTTQKKIRIIFILKIKHQLMHIMLNMKIVEKNFKIMLNILKVFYNNVKQLNKIVNKQRFFMMHNIKMRISLLKFVLYI